MTLTRLIQMIHQDSDLIGEWRFEMAAEIIRLLELHEVKLTTAREDGTDPKTALAAFEAQRRKIMHLLE